MGEQERKMTVTFTLAQYEVLLEAIQEILLYRWNDEVLRKNDRQTLLRSMNRLISAWDDGIKH